MLPPIARDLTPIKGEKSLSPRSNVRETQGLSKEQCGVGGGSTTFSACEERKTQVNNRIVKKFALSSAIPVAKMQQIILQAPFIQRPHSSSG